MTAESTDPVAAACVEFLANGRSVTPPRRIDEQVLILRRELNEQRWQSGIAEDALRRELGESQRRSQDAESATVCAITRASRSDALAEELRVVLRVAREGHLELASTGESEELQEELREELRAAREAAADSTGEAEELRVELRAAQEAADTSWENHRRQRAAASLAQKEAQEECGRLRAELHDEERSFYYVNSQLNDTLSASEQLQQALRATPLGVTEQLQQTFRATPSSGSCAGTQDASCMTQQSEEMYWFEEARFAQGQAELRDARASALDARARERLHRDKVTELQSELRKAHDALAQANMEAREWRYRWQPSEAVGREMPFARGEDCWQNAWPCSERIVDMAPSSPMPWPINTAAEFSFSTATERNGLLEATPPRHPGIDSSVSPVAVLPASKGRLRSGSPHARSAPSLSQRCADHGRTARGPPSPSSTQGNSSQVDPIFREFVRQHAMGQLRSPSSGYDFGTRPAAAAELASHRDRVSVGSSSVGRQRLRRHR